jgi:polysaccharide chain length determinant protein (PEP-CTERM system associated)
MESLKNLLANLPGLRKHRLLGLMIATLTAALGIIAVAMIPSKYEASARAYVDTQSILKPLMVDMAVQPNVEQQLKMMARALLSKPNLHQVAEDAGLFAVEEADNDQAREDLVTRLGVDVKFKPAGRSDFFSLTYRNKSPDVAHKVVASLLEMFVRTTRGDQLRDNKQALAYLDDELMDRETRLVKAEQALKDFKLKNIEVYSELGGSKDYFVRASQAQKEAELANVQLRQARGAANAIRQRLVGVPKSMPVSQTGAAAPTVNQTRLSSARKRLDELSAIYTDLHPDVQNTARIVRDLEQRVKADSAAAPIRTGSGGGIANKLHQDLSIALAGAEADLASARAKASDARQRAQRLRSSAKKVPKVEAEFAQLTRDYEVHKSTYEKLLQRRESALLSGSLDASSGAGDFRVVDPPSVGSSPVWPNRPLFLFIVMLGAISAGLLVAFIAHQAAPSFYGVKELRERTNQPVLGEVGVEPGVGPRAGPFASSLLFWLLALIFVGCFVVLIGISLFGHLLNPSDPAGIEGKPMQPTIDATSTIIQRATQ